MAALYKGLVATGVLSAAFIAYVISDQVGFSNTLTTAAGLAISGKDLFICSIDGLAVTGLIVVITEYYTATNYRPVRSIGQILDHGPWHQRHPGPGDLDGVDGAAGAGHFGRHHRRLCHGRPLRHRVCGHHHAGAGRHDRGARCLWPGHRQCRRHRRNVRPAQGRAQDHRRARRRRQHDQGRHQGLCDRFGGLGLARAVRGLYRGSEDLFPGSGRQLRAAEPLCRDRLVHRRHAALSVRQHGHDRGRPRGRLGRGRGAPAVQGNPRHHRKARPSPIMARRSTF